MSILHIDPYHYRYVFWKNDQEPNILCASITDTNTSLLGTYNTCMIILYLKITKVSSSKYIHNKIRWEHQEQKSGGPYTCVTSSFVWWYMNKKLLQHATSFWLFIKYQKKASLIYVFANSTFIQIIILSKCISVRFHGLNYIIILHECACILNY